MSCGHGVVRMDAASREDFFGQLGDVRLGIQADHAGFLAPAVENRLLKVVAEVGLAEVGLGVFGPFVAHAGAARVCGDDSLT
eukprot:6182224-Pleurochrysis_carterae.AAC.2